MLKRSLKVALATLLFTSVAQASVESTIISQPLGNGGIPMVPVLAV